VAPTWFSVSPPLETGARHAKLADARLPHGAITHLAARFNARCGFNPFAKNGKKARRRSR